MRWIMQSDDHEIAISHLRFTGPNGSRVPTRLNFLHLLDVACGGRSRCGGHGCAWSCNQTRRNKK